MHPTRPVHFVRSLALTAAASWPQCAAAVIVLLYNYLVHKTYIYGGQASGAAFPVAAGYLLIAAGVSTAVKARCSLRLQQLLGCKQGASTRPQSGRAMVCFLKVKILCSAVSWLGSIPVIAAFTLHTYGSLHPLGFPHFCASVVVGLLVSATYSTLLCVRELLPVVPTDSPARADLVALVRRLPAAAAGVPLTVVPIFLCFALPPPAPGPSFVALQALLVTLMTVGGYGYALCYRRVRLDLQMSDKIS